ncbi:MAG: DUF4232 domain-containing protein [Marmoricola sp.]
MSEENLSDLLERAADGHAIGPPPLDQMLARGRSARQRRAGFMALAASVVVGSLIAGTTMLFGHGDTRQNPGDTPPSKQIVLEGEWKVTALFDVQGRSVPETIFGIRFGNSRVTATTRCNYISGPYRQSGPDGRNLEIADRLTVLAQRGQAPDGNLVACVVEPLYYSLLKVRHVSESSGNLYLRDENGKTIATLRRVGAEPVAPILNGLWEATPHGGYKVRVRFDAGTMTETWSNCNTVHVAYRQGGPNGNDLTFGDPNLTGIACSSGEPLLGRLDRVRHVSEENGNLHLQDVNGTTIATLKRVSTAPEARRQYEPCDGGSIRVYAKLGAALGSKGVRLTVTRTAGEPCLLPTYPQTVEFSYRDALLSLPTRLDSSTRPAGSVVLAKGSPATAVLLWGNWCAPVVHNDSIEFRVGTRRFHVRGFVTSPNCGENGGAPGGESLNIRNPIIIGFYARGVERTSTSPGAVAK